MATAQDRSSSTSSLQRLDKEDRKRAENAVRKHYDKLCEAIEDNIARVADKCNEKKLITSGAKKTITSRMSSQDSYQRASDLIGRVRTTVKLLPGYLEEFLLILLEVEVAPTLVKSIALEYGGILPRLARALRDLGEPIDDLDQSSSMSSGYNTAEGSLLNCEPIREEDSNVTASVGYETANDFQSVASALDMSLLSLTSDDIDEDKRLMANAVKKTSSKLAEAISDANTLIKVANQCNEKAIISEGVKNTICCRTTLQDEYERASDLIEKVHSTIKCNPEKFEDFLIILVDVDVDSSLIVEVWTRYGKRLPKFFEHIKDMKDRFLLLKSSDDTVLQLVESNRD